MTNLYCANPRYSSHFPELWAVGRLMEVNCNLSCHNSILRLCILFLNTRVRCLMKSGTLTYPICVTIHFQLRLAQHSFALRNLSEIFVQKPYTYANKWNFIVVNVFLIWINHYSKKLWKASVSPLTSFYRKLQVTLTLSHFYLWNPTYSFIYLNP